MAAEITVLGAETQMGGLTESLARFRKHHIEVGDALLNISGVGTVTGEPVDKDTPRPPQKLQAYPKALHHSNGSAIVVEDPKREKEAKALGFRDEPYPPVRVVTSTPALDKKELLDRNTALQSQLTQQADLLEKLQAQLTELQKGKG